MLPAKLCVYGDGGREVVVKEKLPGKTGKMAQGKGEGQG
jgi:hypothetical protein